MLYDLEDQASDSALNSENHEHATHFVSPTECLFKFSIVEAQ